MRCYYCDRPNVVTKQICEDCDYRQFPLVAMILAAACGAVATLVVIAVF